MAANQLPGEAMASNFAGLSKTQLYDIMSQMKTLIEQNRDQARQILIQNPPLTRALFQAQIMLDMVQPSPTVPNNPPQTSQQAQSSVQPTSVHGQGGMHEPPNVAQTHNPVRRQPQNQPPGLNSSTPIPGVHARSHNHASAMSLPQSSQAPDMPSLPHHQPPLPPVSSQLQQPLQTSGASHHPLQPPLTQSRPTSLSLPHQFQPPMGQNMNFQHPGAQQLHHLQPPFNANMKPSPSSGVMGPPFPHGQQQFQNQHPPSQYQGGVPHSGSDFNNRAGSMQQVDRGSHWPLGPSENVGGSHLPGPPPLAPGQLGVGSQPARPAPISPEMEQVLLQQVMSLTPEQIHNLPPDQRSQVLQLQQMLRQ